MLGRIVRHFLFRLSVRKMAEVYLCKILTCPLLHTMHPTPCLEPHSHLKKQIHKKLPRFGEGQHRYARSGFNLRQSGGDRFGTLAG